MTKLKNSAASLVICGAATVIGSIPSRVEAGMIQALAVDFAPRQRDRRW